MIPAVAAVVAAFFVLMVVGVLLAVLCETPFFLTLGFLAFEVWFFIKGVTERLLKGFQ